MKTLKAETAAFRTQLGTQRECDFGAMWLLPRFVLVLLLGSIAASCSHGTVSDIPSAPTPTITTLTITPIGGGVMIIGNSAPITSSGPFPSTGAELGAFAQYSDGSGRYVRATWTSSDAAVIAVDPASFKAIGRGTVTITASADGKSDTETFAVVPGIPGTWSGTFVVDDCQAGSALINEQICVPPTQGRTGGALAVGATSPITLQITQSGSDLTATAQFGALRGTLSGVDRGLNFLSMRGDLTAATTTVTVVHWDTQVQVDAMEGFIGFEVRVGGVPSFAAVSAHLDKVTRR